MQANVNPRQSLNIQYEIDSLREQLDVLGKSKLIDNISNKFDISELNTGFYILKIISNKKVLAKNTFIKID